MGPISVVVVVAAAAMAAEARPGLDAPVPEVTPPAGTSLQLAAKLVDAAAARPTADGRLTAAADLAELNAIAQAFGLSFRAQVPDAPWVAKLRERAEARSGRPAPDLAGLLWVDGPADARGLRDAGEALRRLSVVEAVWVEVHGVEPPGAMDLEPPTPSYDDHLDWQDDFPGLNHRAAHDLGYTGAGIRVADIEYAFLPSHEDLPPVAVEDDQTPTDPFGPDHGTATLGQIGAAANGYGMTGGAHGAELAFYTEQSVEEGTRRAEAITRACADALPGDLVMLEMQTWGVGGYVPAEYEVSVYLATQVCTDAGVTVIGAAGNGTQDLDSIGYTYYMDRDDSGAILVGAGRGGVDLDPEWFSTYGSRVNVQGWGSSVATLAYGDLAFLDRDARQAYTAVFSGTSSATPTVTSVAALVQEAAIDRTGAPLDPWALRAVLVTSGTPQPEDSADDTPIGPQPDALAAIEAIEADADGDGALGWEDCDDGDAAVYPGAVEDPDNRIDDDCDGVTDEGAFDLGFALAGAAGEPALALTVDGEGGADLLLSGARADARVFLLGGLEREDRPTFGGIAVPSNDLRKVIGTTDGEGGLAYRVRLPDSLSPGDRVYMQLWIEDPDAVEGYAASNAFRVVLQ